MTLEEAKKLAQQGIRVTHEYFTDDEYLTIQGNVIVFEDGARIFFDEWTKDKDYLLDGWSEWLSPEDRKNESDLNTLEGQVEA